MIKRITPKKRPLYLLSGVFFLVYGIILFTLEDQGPSVLVVNVGLGLYFSYASGYLVNYRSVIVAEQNIHLKGIAGFRNRIIQKTEIKRTWENEQAFVIDLADEVVEIDKSIFSNKDCPKVSEALSF